MVLVFFCNSNEPCFIRQSKRKKSGGLQKKLRLSAQADRRKAMIKTAGVI